MKRLTRLIQFAALLAIGIAAGPTTFAQGRDFAGSWTLDVEKTGTKNGPPMAVITQTAKEMTVRFGPDTAATMAFNLDGTERVVKDRSGREATTRAAWKGDKLIATVKMPPPPADHAGDAGPDSVTFSRDGAWLVLEADSKDHGPQKLYFRKASAK